VKIITAINLSNVCSPNLMYKVIRECPPECVKISNLKPEGGWTHEKEV
jgi:hypothetical protein